MKEPPDARKFFGAKMNTAAHSLCQTGTRRSPPGFRWFFPVLAALVLAPTAGRAALPTPPWQSELDAVRLSEATAEVVTARKPAEAAETQRRLGEIYRRLAAKYPDQAAVRKAAGDYFWRVHDPAAIAEWQAAQTLDPTDAEIASALGSARLREGQTSAARAQFQRAVELRPGLARHQFDLANVLFAFRHELVAPPDRPDEAAILHQALAHFRRASELAPENVDFARAYAETFYGVPQPDWAEGFAAWEHVRALTSDAPDFANAHLARVSLRLGKPEQAETYLAAIHNPAFDSMKKSLRRQAEQIKPNPPTVGPTP